MSASERIIRRLVDQHGLSYADIGRVLGRNRSLVRQVGVGSKPGNNLEPVLAQLERRLGDAAGDQAKAAARSAALPAPAARVDRRGHLAKVRRPITHRGPAGWTASTVKRTGVRGGARGLGHSLADAADSGAHVGVTVTVDGKAGIEVSDSGGKRRGGGRAGAGGSAEFQVDAAELADAVAENGGNVAEALAAHMLGEGLVSGTSSAAELAAHMVEIDLRTW